ncbi:TetR/AcrR family transcriptional regulator [Rhodococcus fascians]|nr:TetR/AcrR family transcriptional regulator [Rhodococcus fascians]
MARTNRQSETTRNDILDAADQLMTERGFQGTSIAEICTTSKLPNGSVYRHFQNKNGLLAAVMERGSEDAVDTGHHTSLDSGFYSSRWLRATEAEKRYLVAIARSGTDTPRTATLAETLGSNPQSMAPHPDSCHTQRPHLVSRPRPGGVHRPRDGGVHPPPTQRTDHLTPTSRNIDWVDIEHVDRSHSTGVTQRRRCTTPGRSAGAASSSAVGGQKATTRL